MAEIYEIQRTEYVRLAKAMHGFEYETERKVPEFAIVQGVAKFGHDWISVFIDDGWNNQVESIDGACKLVDVLNRNNLYSLREGWSVLGTEYEVWRIVDDEPVAVKGDATNRYRIEFMDRDEEVSLRHAFDLMECASHWGVEILGASSFTMDFWCCAPSPENVGGFMRCFAYVLNVSPSELYGETFRGYRTETGRILYAPIKC